MNRRVYELLTLASLLVTACGREPNMEVPLTANRYKSWEAPTEFERGYGRQNIHFVDDDTVLYLAREGDGTSALKLWSLADGLTRTLGPSVGDICYFEGRLRYIEHLGPEEHVLREGTLEATSVTNVDARTHYKTLASSGYARHRFNCRYYDKNQLAPEANCKLPLLPGHGYLETLGGRCSETVQRKLEQARRLDSQDNPRTNARQAVIETEILAQPVRHVDNTGKITVLPIEATELRNAEDSIVYLAWANKYALPQHMVKGDYTNVSGRWSSDDYVIYLLSPGGAIERVAIPWGNRFWARPAHILVSRNGVLARASGAATEGSRPLGGVVFARSNVLELIDDGQGEQWNLSPNGCRVAFDTRYRTRVVGDVVTRLRVVDICTRES
jgi:hypothetical protein